MMTKFEHPGEKVLFSSRWFELIAKPLGPGDPYYSIRSLDYLCIVAITPDKKLILVRQHRPVLGLTTLELPGGQVERNETPEQAACKELLEETGYVAPEFVLLGCKSPDTGRLENRMWFFLAENAVPTPDKSYQSEADLTVEFYTGTVGDLVNDDAFLNSMHSTALLLTHLKKRLPLAM